MSITANRSLLGCNTLRDWLNVRSETHLLESIPSISPERENMLLEFALQGVAPFCVCVVYYKEQILLLNGVSELSVLLNLITNILSINNNNTTTFNLLYQRRNQILDIRIPHCDFTVDSQEDLDMLQRYYKLSSRGL